VWLRLRALRPDLICITGYSDEGAWVSWVWGLLHKRPVVISSENNEYDRPRKLLRERIKGLLVRRCAAGVAYGRDSSNYLVRLGLRAEQVIGDAAVIELGSLTGESREVKRKEHEIRLLSIGRLLPQKNFEFLLASFAAYVSRTPETALRLRIVGSGPEEETLARIVRTAGLEHVVELCGGVASVDVAALYRSADYFVLASRVERWGLVVAEAMACRLPVLVSRQCGCATDLVTEKTGWLFSPTDESNLNSLFGIIERLPEARRLSMGAAARAHVERYAPEVVAARIGQAIEDRMWRAPEDR
jgi:glycosyltransferase involved in cell wall biosynthesis